MIGKQLLLKQTYWLDDTEDTKLDKLNRLNEAIESVTVPVVVEVRPYKKPRSPEANAYLWGVCYAHMSVVAGEEKEELHAAMCKKHFGTKLVDIMGMRFERAIRTTTHNEHGEKEWLGVKEFAEFVDFVIREAAIWYDIAIPPPTPKEVPRA